MKNLTIKILHSKFQESIEHTLKEQPGHKRFGELNNFLEKLDMYFGDETGLYDSNHQQVANLISDPEELTDWLYEGESL